MFALTLTPEMWRGVVLGGVGGVIRVLAGTVKLMNARFKIYWGMTLAGAVIHAVIGGALGLVFYLIPAASLLAGFGGLDALDRIYKAFSAQKVVAVPDQRRRSS